MVKSIAKLIHIKEEQNEWIKERCLNFSMWVRKKIDEEMNNERGVEY